MVASRSWDSRTKSISAWSRLTVALTRVQRTCARDAQASTRAHAKLNPPLGLLILHVEQVRDHELSGNVAERAACRDGISACFVQLQMREACDSVDSGNGDVSADDVR